jgi:hypothetical protein
VLRDIAWFLLFGPFNKENFIIDLPHFDQFLAELLRISLIIQQFNKQCISLRN